MELKDFLSNYEKYLNKEAVKEDTTSRKEYFGNKKYDFDPLAVVEDDAVPKDPDYEYPLNGAILSNYYDIEYTQNIYGQEIPNYIYHGRNPITGGHILSDEKDFERFEIDSGKLQEFAIEKQGSGDKEWYDERNYQATLREMEAMGFEKGGGIRNATLTKAEVKKFLLDGYEQVSRKELVGVSNADFNFTAKQYGFEYDPKIKMYRINEIRKGWNFYENYVKPVISDLEQVSFNFVNDGNSKDRNTMARDLKPIAKDVRSLEKKSRKLTDEYFKNNPDDEEDYAEGGGVKKPRLKKGDSVYIYGKTWFQRSYGNTYHITKVYVNDKVIGISEKSYGYGEQYIQTGMDILWQNYTPPYKWKLSNPAWMLKNFGIKYEYEETEVSRESDLTHTDYAEGGEIGKYRWYEIDYYDDDDMPSGQSLTFKNDEDARRHAENFMIRNDLRDFKVTRTDEVADEDYTNSYPIMSWKKMSEGGGVKKKRKEVPNITYTATIKVVDKKGKEQPTAIPTLEMTLSSDKSVAEVKDIFKESIEQSAGFKKGNQVEITDFYLGSMETPEEERVYFDFKEEEEEAENFEPRVERSGKWDESYSTLCDELATYQMGGEISAIELQRGDEWDVSNQDHKLPNRAIRYNVDKGRYELYNYTNNEVDYSYRELSDLIRNVNNIFNENFVPTLAKGGRIDRIKNRIPFQTKLHETELAELKSGKRKTINQYFVQGNYGYGFEDLTAHNTKGEATLEKITYEENERYPFRVVTKRVKKADFESGNFSKGGMTKDEKDEFKRRYAEYEIDKKKMQEQYKKGEYKSEDWFGKNKKYAKGGKIKVGDEIRSFDFIGNTDVKGKDACYIEGVVLETNTDPFNPTMGGVYYKSKMTKKVFGGVEREVPKDEIFFSPMQGVENMMGKKHDVHKLN